MQKQLIRESLFQKFCEFFHSRKFLPLKYFDDSSYVINNDFDTIKKQLIKNFKQLTTWFQENYMALNPEKCLSKNKKDKDSCLDLCR